jgi:hypothetical protein
MLQIDSHLRRPATVPRSATRSNCCCPPNDPPRARALRRCVLLRSPAPPGSCSAQRAHRSYPEHSWQDHVGGEACGRSTELLAARHSCSSEAARCHRPEAPHEADPKPTDPAPGACSPTACSNVCCSAFHLRGLGSANRPTTDVAAEIWRTSTPASRGGLQARERGDDSAELCRLEAALLSKRITGLGSALQWNGASRQRCSRLASSPKRSARARRPRPAQAAGAEAARPGSDKALEHFEFAANALQDDERLRCSRRWRHLQQKREQAIAWLEQAAQRNPNNAFVRVVLARCKRGEENPFGRDVTEAEVNRAK